MSVTSRKFLINNNKNFNNIEMNSSQNVLEQLKNELSKALDDLQKKDELIRILLDQGKEKDLSIKGF